MMEFQQNFEELINCDFVDVIIICTPNFQHIHTLRKVLASCCLTNP